MSWDLRRQCRYCRSKKAWNSGDECAIWVCGDNIRACNYHDDGEHIRTGILIGGKKPRILEVQLIAVKSNFPENLLYLRNYVTPGFIGDLGSLYCPYGLNIETSHPGCRDIGGEATARVEIDRGQLEGGVR